MRERVAPADAQREPGKVKAGGKGRNPGVSQSAQQTRARKSKISECGREAA